MILSVFKKSLTEKRASPMQLAPDFSALIGNTPLIRLNSVSDLTGCEIFGKAEFMNPGGSVKDRAAKAIIEHAEKTG